MSLPLVTVVLCTRNRSGLLRGALETLASLVTDELFQYEVLVLDNGSTDDTQDVVREFMVTRNLASVPELFRTVVEPQAGIVPARNRGVKEARGEWIAFFDDDQFADPRWLLELFLAACERRTRCVGGAVHLKLPEGVDRPLAPVSRMLLGETVGMDHPRTYNARVTPGCGNLMVHRSLFDEVGLFDTRIADRGEDTDMALRIMQSGEQAWYTPKAVVHHRIPAERLTDEFLMFLSRRMARGMAGIEHEANGGWKYPFVWCARIGQAALVLGPRLLIARLKRDRERALAARCRLQIAFDSIGDGARIILNDVRGLLSRRPNSSLTEKPLAAGAASTR